MPAGHAVGVAAVRTDKPLRRNRGFGGDEIRLPIDRRAVPFQRLAESLHKCRVPIDADAGGVIRNIGVRERCRRKRREVVGDGKGLRLADRRDGTDPRVEGDFGHREGVREGAFDLVSTEPLESVIVGARTVRNRQDTALCVREFDDAAEERRFAATEERSEFPARDSAGKPGCRRAVAPIVRLGIGGRDTRSKTFVTRCSGGVPGDGSVDAGDRGPADSAEFDRDERCSALAGRDGRGFETGGVRRSDRRGHVYLIDSRRIDGCRFGVGIAQGGANSFDRGSLAE